MSAAMRDVVLSLVKMHGLEQVFIDIEHVGEVHLRLVNAPYMPLDIERLYCADHGRQVVSVTHYGRQNGDAMRDPEMVFDFADWRELYLRNDYAHTEEYVFTDPQRSHYYPRLAREFKSFSAMWARNLLAQGFLSKRPVATSLSHPRLLPDCDQARQLSLAESER